MSRHAPTLARLRVALAVAAAAFVLAGDTTSFAQDGKKGGNGGGRQGPKDEKPKEKEKEKEKEKDKKDTAEWKALEAIGREFASKDAAKLVARMIPDRKLKIHLGDYDAEYASDQAKGVLQKWFDSKKGAIAVSLTKLEGDVGIFTMSITNGDKTRTWPLHIEIRKKDKGEGFHLVRIENPSAE